jgi:hypothetical protein
MDIGENELDGTFGEKRGNTRSLNRDAEANRRQSPRRETRRVWLSGWAIELDLSNSCNHGLNT